MSDVREVLADHTRNVLLVLGVALVLLGGVGPGPVGAVSVLGIVVVLAAFLLDEPIASLLRSTDTDRDGGSPDDPVAELRERYVRGELDREEFERRVERLLEDDDPWEERDPGASGGSAPDVLTGTDGSSGLTETN